MHRSRRTRALALGLAIAGVGGLALAQQPAPGPAPQGPTPQRSDEPDLSDEAPGIVVVDRETLAATVEEVDLRARTVTLKGPAGNVVVLAMPRDAAGFAELAVGDDVSVSYLESVAIAIRRADAPAPPHETIAESMAVAPRGRAPEAMASRVEQTTARVTAIDASAREISLRGPDGIHTIAVDPRVHNLADIHAGDEVTVHHTTALALSLAQES
jgi:hypothetical protein